MRRPYQEQYNQQQRYFEKNYQELMLDLKSKRQEYIRKLSYYDTEHKKTTQLLQESQYDFEEVLTRINQQENNKLCAKAIQIKAKDLIEFRTQAYQKDIIKIKNSRMEETKIIDSINEEKELREKSWQIIIDTIEEELLQIQAMMQEMKKDTDGICRMQERLITMDQQMRDQQTNQKEKSQNQQNILSRLLENMYIL